MFIDKNECASSPCLHGATCVDDMNKYLCSCVDGYTGQQCELGVSSV